MLERGLKRIRIDNLGGILFVGEALTKSEIKKLIKYAQDEGVSWVVVESYPVLGSDNDSFESSQETSVSYSDPLETLKAYEGLITTLESVNAGMGALEFAYEEYNRLRKELLKQ